MKPNFKMLGSLKFEGKTYGITDNKGMVSAETLGLHNFYGGRVKKLGVVDKTKTKGIYLCIEGIEAIDIIQFDVEAKKGDLPVRDKQKEEVKVKAVVEEDEEDAEDDPFLEEDSDEDDESEDIDFDENENGEPDDSEYEPEDEGTSESPVPAAQGSSLPRKSRQAKRAKK